MVQIAKNNEYMNSAAGASSDLDENNFESFQFKAAPDNYDLAKYRASQILKFQPIDSANNSSQSYRDVSLTPKTFSDLLLNSDFGFRDNPEVIPVNLSDFDGTLTSGLSGSLIFEYAATNNFFLEVVRPKLNQMLDFFDLPKNSSNSIGQDFLEVLAAFRKFSNNPNINKIEKEAGTQKVYEMLSWIYAGHTQEEITEFAEKAFREIAYEDFHFDGAKEMIRALKEVGIETLLISVKFQGILEVAARFFEIPAENTAGMKLKKDSRGYYTTEIEPPATFKEGKAQVAEILLNKFRAGKTTSAKPLFAMGDSPTKSDRQLLEMSWIPVVVEPQTVKDAEHALNLANSNQSVIILDFEKTSSGLEANTYDRHLVEQKMPSGKYL